MFNKKLEVVESSYSKVFQIPHNDDVILTETPVQEPPFSFRKKIIQQIQKLAGHWQHLTTDNAMENVKFFIFHSAMSNTVYKISLTHSEPESPISFIIRIYGTGTDSSYMTLVKTHEQESRDLPLSPSSTQSVSSSLVSALPGDTLTPVSSKSNLYQFENVSIESSAGEKPLSSLNHSLESLWMCLLSEQRVSPHVYAQFGNGRIEETILDGSPLTADTIRAPKIAQETALQLGKLHSSTDSLRRLAIRLYREYYHKDPKTSEYLNRDLNYWNVIMKSLQSVQSDLFQYPSFHSDNKEEDQSLVSRISSIERLVHRIPPNAHVFCHSDLQYGNIMVGDFHRSNRTAVILIDYEYGAFGPAAFDVANHFFEWMCNYHTERPHVIYPEKYPGEEEIRSFLRNYFLSLIVSSRSSSGSATPEQERQQERGRGGTRRDREEEEEEEEQQCSSSSSNNNNTPPRSPFSPVTPFTPSSPPSLSLSLSSSYPDLVQQVDSFLEKHFQEILWELKLFTCVSDLKWSFWGIQQYNMRSQDSNNNDNNNSNSNNNDNNNQSSENRAPLPNEDLIEGKVDPNQFYLDYSSMRINHFWSLQTEVLSSPFSTEVEDLDDEEQRPASDYPLSNFLRLFQQ
jgi:thiamine kinase-like enzyme